MKKNKTTIDDVTSYLTEQYDDTFSLVSFGNELWNKKYSEIVYSSEKLNAEVVAWVYENGTIVDNYMAVKYKTNVEQFVSPLVEDVYGDSLVVNIPIHYGEKHFNKDLTFTDYIANESSDISIKIATYKDTNNVREDAEKLVLKFKENNIIASITVFYYTKAEFETIKITNKSTEIFYPLSDRRLYVSMNEDYLIDFVDWSE